MLLVLHSILSIIFLNLFKKITDEYLIKQNLPKLTLIEALCMFKVLDTQASIVFSPGNNTYFAI